jgi:hypothetical protein
MRMQPESEGQVVKILAWVVVLASLGLYAIEAWMLASAIFGLPRP